MSINALRIFAIIPARGGSKGVPQKNMRIVNGTPLIGYTINAAKASSYIDRVFVSSDDNEILSYASNAGVNVIKRPSIYSGDLASANDVVTHFISTLSKQDVEENPFLIYLQPTSPLRNEIHIDEAFEKMLSLCEERLISVNLMSNSPFKAFVLDDKNKLKSLFDEKMSNMRRQDLPQVYLPNGAIYIFRIEDFIKQGGFPSNGSLPFIMNMKDSIDIDTESDIQALEIEVLSRA